MEEIDKLRARVEALEILLVNIITNIAHASDEQVWNALFDAYSQTLAGPFGHDQQENPYDEERQAAGVRLLKAFMARAENI